MLSHLSWVPVSLGKPLFFSSVLMIGLGLSACSDRSNHTKFSEAEIEQDYGQLPQGILVRVPQASCQPSELTAHAASPDAAHPTLSSPSHVSATLEQDMPEIRLISGDISHMNGDQMDSFFNSQNAIRPGHDTITKYMDGAQKPEMLNLPNHFIALKTQETAQYPEEYSLDQHLWQHHYLHSPEQTPSQSPHQGSSKNLGKGQGKNSGKNSVSQTSPVQQGKNIKGPTTPSPAQTPAQISPVQQTPPTVSQAAPINKHQAAQTSTKGPEPSPDQTTFKHEHSTIQKQTPAPPPLLDEAQGALELDNNAAEELMTGSAAQLDGQQNTQHTQVCEENLLQRNNYFLGTYRPAIQSEGFSSYNWGYYDEPRTWQSDSSTYYYYPKPRCNSYDWCR